MSPLKFFYRALYKRDTLGRRTFVRVQITQCDRRKGRRIEDELKSSEIIKKRLLLKRCLNINDFIVAMVLVDDVYDLPGGHNQHDKGKEEPKRAYVLVFGDSEHGNG